MAVLTPTPKQQFFDSNGTPLAGGKLYSYAAGTTTPLATYTSAAGNIANTNPIILDTRGEAEVWLGSGSYKLTLKTSADVSVWTVDNILGPATPADITAAINALKAELAAPDGSSLIGFIADGAQDPQDARTVEEKLRDIVSVKDFGAVGDGVVDDTQAFIDAGEGAFVPDGEYYVDTSLVDVWLYQGNGLIKAHTGQTIWLEGCLGSPRIVQKKMMEPFFGFDNGTTNTQIFSGAQNASQGMAYVDNGVAEKIYILQPGNSAGSFNSDVVTAGSFVIGLPYEIVTVGTTNFTLIGAASNTVGVRFTATGVGTGDGTAAEVETRRIVEFTFADNGGVVSNTLYTSDFVRNHQSLSAIMDNGDLYLYTQYFTQPTYRGSNGGKGYAKILWNGASTNSSNVTNYQLFGYSGSGHKYAEFAGATPCVSADGKYVVVVATDTTGGVAEDTVNWMFVYDRAYVEALPNPLDAVPSYYSQVPPPANADHTQYNQGVACDGRYVYIWRGFYAPRLQHIIQKFDLYGNLLGEYAVDDARAQYGVDGLLNNPTLGNPASFEPEGIALRGQEILVLVMDNWRANCPVVSYKGKNFAAYSTNSNVAPDNSLGSLEWVDTTKSATSGPWQGLVGATATVLGGSYTIESIGTTNFTLIGAASNTVGLTFTATGAGTGTGTVVRNYVPGNYTRRTKLIYSVRPPMGGTGEESLDQALTTRISGASVNSRANQIDISFPQGNALQVSGYSENTELYTNHFQYSSDGSLRLYDPSPRSDNAKFFSTKQNYDLTPDLREFTEIRVASNVASGAGINLYGNADSFNPTRFRFFAGGNSGGFEVFVDLINSGGALALRPNGDLDGLINLGGASNRWNTVYAATGAINTSDARSKQQIRPLEDAERAVAIRCKGLLRAFKFNDAVNKKGDGARIHFGVVAQDLAAAFQAEGLDPHKYAMFCYDEWEDEWDERADTKERVLVNPAGNAYGVRYEELLAFIIAAI